MLDEFVPENDGNETAINAKRRRTSKKCVEDKKFIDVLEKHGKVLLDKRLTPNIKASKEVALEKMEKILQLDCGIFLNQNQIKKKKNNLKSRLKQKNDIKKTGNIAIILTESEEKLYVLLGGVDNPSVSKVPYGLAIGDGSTSNLRFDDDFEIVEEAEQYVTSYTEDEHTAQFDSVNKKIRTKTKPNLKTLQETVLVEQLNLIR